MTSTFAIPETNNRIDRTPVAVRADNLIRQRLRIGDPRDPRQIAEGLKRLFPSDARAQALEAEGLPTLPAQVGVGPARAIESQATSSELKQAVDNVERDLAALTNDHRLKEIVAELQGWGQAIRIIIADGAAAARLALDPLARDRLFGARRALGDYARLARMIGALTLTLNQSYRRLARSLDEVSSLLLVLAGESLAAYGLGGGRFLLSVPASELQARRDAILMALRTLLGSSEQAHGGNQWPWGLNGLREMLLLIERSGHFDLRALLDENVLGGLLDELIERASQSSAASLRALGATSEVTAQRLYRLLHVVDNRVAPPSPPVTSFLKAIQLFLDAFRASASGYRLLFVARAPVSFSGLSRIGGQDPGTQRLISLVVERGRFAELLDCYLGCDCCSDDVLCQILLDKLLYDTDRAVDLYTLGDAPNGDGEPEWRAAAFGLLALEFLNPTFGAGEAAAPYAACLQSQCFSRIGELQASTEAIRDLLTVGKLNAAGAVIQPDPDNAHRGLITDELCLQRITDSRLGNLIATLASGCVSGSTVLTRIQTLIDNALARVNPAHARLGGCQEVEITPPPTAETSLELFNDIREGLERINLIRRR